MRSEYVVNVTDAAGELPGYWHSLSANQDASTNSGNDAADNSKVDPFAVEIGTGAGGQPVSNNLNADFGYFVQPASLGNFVWHDLNGNGIQDAGEPGLDGVKVTLTANYMGGVSYTLATVTGDDPATVAVEKGWYSFGNLLLDEDNATSKTGAPTSAQPVYTLAVPAAPAGYTPTLLNQGANDLIDADDPAGVDGLATQGQTNVTQNATPNSETDPIAGYDFGFVVADFDYGDLPDAPYPTLLASNGARHVIVAGSAYLGSVAPDTEVDGQPNATATGDDIAGAAPDDEEGVVFLTPLPPGKSANIQVTITDPDGNACLSAFIDFDGNGTLDAVTYTAIDGAPSAGTVGDLSLTSGVHTLTISVPTNTAGITPTRFRLTDACGQGGNSPTGAASSGEVEDYALAALGDFVWEDNNLNGLQDAAGEPGVANATVKLLKADFTAVLDADGNPITTLTDGSGKYEFPGLPAGTYRVQFVRPAGYDSFTTAHAGADPAIDSDASPANGFASPAVTLGAGQVNTTVDAGLVTTAITAGKVAIGNVIWCDDGAGGGTTDDGIKQSGELGLPGVAVRLYSLGPDNTAYTADDVLVNNTATATDGTYYFTGVTPGSYYVAVVPGTVPGSCGSYPTSGGGGPANTADSHNKGSAGTGGAAGLVVSAVLDATQDAVAAPDSTIPDGYAPVDAFLTVDFGFTEHADGGHAGESERQPERLAGLVAEEPGAVLPGTSVTPICRLLLFRKGKGQPGWIDPVARAGRPVLPALAFFADRSAGPAGCFVRSWPWCGTLYSRRALENFKTPPAVSA